MPTSANVPVTVTAEAAARIADLGIQTEVDRMLDYARRQLPDLDRIDVVLFDRYEQGDEPGLAIDAFSRRPFDPADRVEDDLVRWMVTEFSPAIRQHVLLSYRHGVSYAG